MPTVEQTKIILEDGEEEDGEKGETVRFCRLDDNDYSAICIWLGRNPCYTLKPIDVMFEGKRKLRGNL